MAVRKNIIGFIPFLALLSCAQVGEISGGEKDEVAPKPIAEKTIPTNESLNFKGKSVKITFDEFVQLNNPQQTVIFVPNHAKPKTTLTKKTLEISWEETLEENTTYVIYLNRTVKDLSENNDSLMYYVFSTGETLDSLRYSIRAVDAWTNQPIANATVGLFTHKDSLKPYYFANTDPTGLATFSFLKTGTYFVRAFLDQNKDLLIQNSESIGFKTEEIQLVNSIVDSIPIRIFKPKEAKKIRSVRYSAPGSILLGANFPIENAAFFIQNKRVEKEFIRPITSDSVQLFTQEKEVSDFQIRVNTTDRSDTLSLRVTQKEKTAKIQLKPLFNTMIAPSEAISFQCNDVISAIDSSKIEVKNPRDSTLFIPFKTNFSQNTLFLEIDRDTLKQVDITFKPGAITTAQDEKSDAVKANLKFSLAKDYGAIILDLSNFKAPIIVELLQNSNVARRVILKQPSSHVFNELSPNEYQFRIISDSNENGIWDTGELYNDVQPEKVYWYSAPTRVRANWDINLQISPVK
jgi:uncharacterized protein (DUF2141 family)/catabolite regulation protein CreA